MHTDDATAAATLVSPLHLTPVVPHRAWCRWVKVPKVVPHEPTLASEEHLDAAARRVVDEHVPRRVGPVQPPAARVDGHRAANGPVAPRAWVHRLALATPRVVQSMGAAVEADDVEPRRGP